MLSKVTSFLPQMEAANSKLMAEMQVSPMTIDDFLITSIPVVHTYV